MAVYYVDEYERQLDERGRIILPSKIRERITPCVYITRSPSDKCIHIYDETEWAVMSEKLRALPVTTDKNAGAFVRMFFGKAACGEVDKQGRVCIPKRLIEYAGIEKDVVLVGANTRLELWAAEQWREYETGISEDCITEGVLKYGLNI